MGMTLFSLAFLLCPSFPAGQVPDLGLGYQAIGADRLEHFGSKIAIAGDHDGDGVSEFLAYSPPGTGHNRVSLCDGATGNRLSYLYSPGYSYRVDHFGSGLTGGRDADGDGVEDFAIGAPQGGTIYGHMSGAVWLYSGATRQVIREFGGHWSTHHSMGGTLLLCNDFDQDGLADIFISDLNWQDEGKVECYSTGTGSLLFTLEPLPGHSRFGGNVGAVPDVDGDGLEDYVVCAPGPWPSNQDGSIYLYSGQDASLLFVLDSSTQPNIGYRGAVGSEDLDGDGLGDLLVSLADSSTNTTAVSTVSGAPGAFLNTAWEIYSFGRNSPSLAPCHDLNWDGVPEVFVGMPKGNRFELLSGSDLTSIYQSSSSIQEEGLGSPVVPFPNSSPFDDLPDLLVSAPSAGFDDWDRYYGKVFSIIIKPVTTLFATPDSLSVSQGGVAHLGIDLGADFAQERYRILMSGSGLGFFMAGNVRVPLTRDGLTDRSYQGIYPFQVSSGMHGHLDEEGRASAHIAIPIGHLPSSLVGQSVYCSALVTSPASGPIGSTSPVWIEFRP